MFVPCWDRDGEKIDPRDVPAAPTTTLWRSNQARFAAVLNARVDALSDVDQLQLLTELGSCKAVLDWTHCKTASGLAIKDLASPLVQEATRRAGGCQLIRLGGDGTPEVSEGIITEVSLALSCSERAAQDFISVGLDLRFRLRCTNNEFGGGRISYAHAKVISETTRPLDIDLAERLDARLADAATTRTPARLRVLARRLVAKTDPAGLARRHARAMAERSASIFPIGDGMAAFSLTHGLDVAATIDDQLSAWAVRRRAADPETSFAAHRADAAALLLLGRHPLTGAPLLPEEAVAPTATPSTPNSAPDEKGAAGRSAAQAAPTGHQPVRPSDVLAVRTDIRLTMPGDTLLGIDDQTCDLDGYGPITAEQARRLALTSSSAVLRRIFTDPIDDSVMTMDARTYRFTAAQAEAIRVLHPISTFPGSVTPADRCDLDHRGPYRHAPPGRDPDPGQTVVTNGQPLGRRKHRIRTHLRWTAIVDPADPHTIHWTSPHGLHYTVEDHHGA